MTERPPSLKADQVIRVLRRAGFEVARIKDSHHVLRHCDDPSRGTVVPVHAGGLLRKIIGDAGLTVDEFKPLL